MSAIYGNAYANWSDGVIGLVKGLDGEGRTLWPGRNAVTGTGETRSAALEEARECAYLWAGEFAGRILANGGVIPDGTLEALAEQVAETAAIHMHGVRTGRADNVAAARMLLARFARGMQSAGMSAGDVVNALSDAFSHANTVEHWWIEPASKDALMGKAVQVMFPGEVTD